MSKDINKKLLETYPIKKKVYKQLTVQLLQTTQKKEVYFGVI
jgi:hypothetical protein